VQAIDLEREVARLDRNYIKAVGHVARTALLAGQAVALAYTPDNATQYDLVLTPGNSLVQLGGDKVPRGFGHLRDVVVIAVSNFENSHPWAVSLLDRFPQTWLAPWYVAEKLGVGEGDAIAITALLAEIADNPAVLLGSAPATN
jgi:hypothetical protein